MRIEVRLPACQARQANLQFAFPCSGNSALARRSFALALVLGLAAAANGAEATLSGTIVADGKAVPGATVVVAEGPPALRSINWLTASVIRKAPDVLASAQADDSGHFTVALPAEVPGYDSWRWRLAVWGYHPGHSPCVRLIERDWPQAGLPLTLALERAASVRLKIEDAAGQFVAAARLTPLRLAGQDVPAALTERLAAESDAGGRATLSGAPAELDAVRIESHAHGVQWAGVRPSPGNEPRTIQLAPVGRLVGRLTASEPRAVRHRRLRFATFHVPGDDGAGGGLAEAVTDEEGKFEVPAVTAGSLTFEIDSDDSQVFRTAETVGPDIEAGKTTTFDIPLERAVPVSIEVRNRDDNSPIAGVRVLLMRVSFRQGLPGGTLADTDASGRLTAPLLPGRVVAEAIRIPPPYYDPKRTSGGDTIAADAEHASLTPMHLARGKAVRGRVVDDQGRPLAGAEIFGFWPLLSGLDAVVCAWSDAHGEFTIDRVAPDTQVRLWARHGEATNVEPVFARPGAEPVSLVVSQQACVSLEGRVLDSAGQPIAGAAVRIWPRQAQYITGFIELAIGSVLFDGRDRLMTNSDGRFRTPRCLRPNMKYSLEVQAPGMLPCQTEAIEPATWHTTRFADVVLCPMPRLRGIEGRVVDSEGRAVAGAVVWQSGDGPRRTETTSGEDGGFRLSGIYDGPAFVFARKDGFRMGGARVAAADKSCEIVLRRPDEPARAMTALAPRVPTEEQCKLAMSLVEPLMPMLRDPVFSNDHRRLLEIVERADPSRALEIADTILTNPQMIALVRRSVALALVENDFDEALAVMNRLERPYDRAFAYLQAWDALAERPREQTDQLLSEALIHARAEPEAGLKLVLFARIAERWLDLGERARGTALLREGQALADELPRAGEVTQRDRGAYLSARFAASLARIDGPAAERLIEGFDKPHSDWLQGGVARGLADHDAAEAERLFNRIESPTMRFRYGLPMLHCMATNDRERAVRLARSFPRASEQSYALGIVAHRLAAKDRAAAAGLLDEAFTILERAYPSGHVEDDDRNAAAWAAPLLAVAEKIDPRLVEGFIWRVLVMRPSRCVYDELSSSHERNVAELAALLARYDPDVARDLLEPFAGRMRELMGEAELPSLFSPLVALAVSDASWAYDLVQALPDAPVKPTESPKQAAARVVAEWLGFTQGALWRRVYDRCSPSNPDQRDDAPRD